MTESVRKRLADLAASTRTREPVELVIGEEVFPLDLRLLSVGEEASVLVRARTYAIEQGIAEPSEADALYEMGKMIATVASSLVERDSPKEAPVAVFENDAELLAHPLVTHEHVAYLYAKYTFFADAHSPRALVLDADRFLHVLHRSAEGDPLPFCELRPGAQWSFVRTLAVQHVHSPVMKSPSSSPSEASH